MHKRDRPAGRPVLTVLLLVVGVIAFAVGGAAVTYNRQNRLGSGPIQGDRLSEIMRSAALDRGSVHVSRVAEPAPRVAPLERWTEDRPVEADVRFFRQQSLRGPDGGMADADSRIDVRATPTGGTQQKEIRLVDGEAFELLESGWRRLPRTLEDDAFTRSVHRAFAFTPGGSGDHLLTRGHRYWLIAQGNEQGRPTYVYETVGITELSGGERDDWYLRPDDVDDPADAEGGKNIVYRSTWVLDADGAPLRSRIAVTVFRTDIVTTTYTRWGAPLHIAAPVSTPA